MKMASRCLVLILSFNFMSPAYGDNYNFDLKDSAIEDYGNAKVIPTVVLAVGLVNSYIASVELKKNLESLRETNVELKQFRQAVIGVRSFDWTDFI